MNDVTNAPGKVQNSVVRPRDAASLILLRGEGKDLEVLAGRRPLHVRFMPGVHVFPGGAIDPPDHVPWNVEMGTEALGPKLARGARAALRETWEEARVLVGRRTPSHPAVPATRPIERAYREHRLVAAMDLLTYVGRAITPPNPHTTPRGRRPISGARKVTTIFPAIPPSATKMKYLAACGTGTFSTIATIVGPHR